MVTCQGLFRWLFGCRRKKYVRLQRIGNLCQMMTALGEVSQLCSYLFKELELRKFGGQALIFISLLTFLYSFPVEQSCSLSSAINGTKGVAEWSQAVHRRATRADLLLPHSRSHNI